MKFRERPSWDNYFMKIAEDIGSRSTCLRRHYGAVIVDKDNRIVATGYNGAMRGCEHCSDKGICKREELGIKHGEHYELCEAVHAEANAIINCDPKYFDGTSKIYIYGVDNNNEKVDSRPCLMCARMIANAKLKSKWFKLSDDKFELIEGDMYLV